MKKIRHCYFVATFLTKYQTKVELSLPLHIDTWYSAVCWLSPRVPKEHVLVSIRVELLPPENLCDNHETQKEKEILAE